MTRSANPADAPPAADPVAGGGTAIAGALHNTVLALMGVSGCGKTSVALELRRVLGWPYVDGDDLHPAANVEKMRSGVPLLDADRWPWLERVAHWIDQRLAAGEPGIITCSNLKRAYRRVTIGDRQGVTLVYLHAPEPVIAARLAQRRHRYMPASLLRSQFRDLEEPGADEWAVLVEADGTLADTVVEVLRKTAEAQTRGT